MERPWKLGAKWTNKHIASDEKIETFELDYDGKRDRWNGYDASTYARVIERYEARKKYLKEQKLKKSEKSNQNDEDEEEENLMLDEAKVDESKQMRENLIILQRRVKCGKCYLLMNHSIHSIAKTVKIYNSPLGPLACIWPVS